MSNIKTITPNPPADFTPTMGDYVQLSPFRYWCQKVLPLVYDDSLSYYELLCKVVDYLNKAMEDIETLHGDVNSLLEAYKELQDYVNNYFSSLDVQEEINNKLDELVNSGRLNVLLNTFIPYVTPEMFGAKGDGITDDTVALNNMLNEIKNSFYKVIGKGRYLITQSLTFTGNFCVELNELIFNNTTDSCVILDNVKRSKLLIKSISGNGFTPIDIKGVYNHQAGVVLKNSSYNDICINNITNMLCGFILYSNGTSGEDGTYYNTIYGYSVNTYNVIHIISENGAVNGNTFRNILHFINSTYVRSVKSYYIINDTNNDYKNNHNIFLDIKIEQDFEDVIGYYLACVEKTTNFYVRVARIEMLSTPNISDLIIVDSNTADLRVDIMSSWLNNRENLLSTGTRNVVNTYNQNYVNYLKPIVYNDESFKLSDSFSKIEGAINELYVAHYKRNREIKIQGSIKTNTTITQNVNTILGTANVKPAVIGTGIIYEIGSSDPSILTPCGIIRQVEDSYNIYVKTNKQFSASSYLFIDITLRY